MIITSNEDMEKNTNLGSGHGNYFLKSLRPKNLNRPTSFGAKHVAGIGTTSLRRVDDKNCVTTVLALPHLMDVAL
jgi:hypothetical protein